MIVVHVVGFDDKQNREQVASKRDRGLVGWAQGMGGALEGGVAGVAGERGLDVRVRFRVGGQARASGGVGLGLPAAHAVQLRA